MDNTAVTNLFSSKPARGIVNRLMQEKGPLSALVPAFPQAGDGLAPLKAASETKDRTDFSLLWSGQAASLSSKSMSAEALTGQLLADAKHIWEGQGAPGV